jgi:hypothetical protein
MGLPPAGDDAANAFDNPLGVYDAMIVTVKAINTDRFKGIAIEFELTDPEYQGEEYVLMAEALVEGEPRKDAKKKVSKWRRIGQAWTAMGVAHDRATMQPLDGWKSVEGTPCRLAVSTYKAGSGEVKPTIVLGRPKTFDNDLRDERGRFPDYGCGVLPPE